jgi:hypothetical protein
MLCLFEYVESNVVFSLEVRCSRSVLPTLSESNVVVSQEARCSRRVFPTLPKSKMLSFRRRRGVRGVSFLSDSARI